MLRIDMVQTIEGVTVYGDGDSYNKFYLIPNQARYRKLPDGSYAFKYMKYRLPIDRGGDKPAGGGFLLFDTEFVVPEEKIASITATLQSQVNRKANELNDSPAPIVEIGTLTYTKGSVSLIFAGGGTDNTGGEFVEKYTNVGKSSLYGNNIASFGLELTEHGAPFYEQAMQGHGGAVSVAYDLTFWAELPEIKIDAYFEAEEFYEFHQTIDTDWSLWGEDEYTESIREEMESSEAMNIEFDWGGVTDEEIRAPLRSWATNTFEEAIERKMIEAIAPVPEDQRDAPEGIEDVTRDITSEKISSFELHFKETQSVEWNIVPQGMLQNITSLKDGNGNDVVWEEYAHEVDLADDFFKELRVNTYVNADFEKLPIHSVEVKVLYDGRPMANMIQGEPEGEAMLKKVEDIGKFATYVENDNWEYTYSYQINYKGESRIFQSEEITTNEGNLTIGVSDIGILDVEVFAADLNWEDVDSALVTFEYEDSGADVDLVKDQFVLTKDAPSHKIQEVIFAPMRKNYKYSVKYFMKGGKEIQGDEFTDRSSNLYVNDVFGGRKKMGIRGIGDFENKISKIFLDLTYTDTANEYTQTESVMLNKAKDFHDWSFPVISDTAGKVSYSGTVVYNDGTNEEILPTDATSNTILVPKPVENIVEISVIPDLLDWEQVKLARVDLSYADGDTVKESETLMFSATKNTTQTWKLEMRDRDQDKYKYKATYYLAPDNRQVTDEKDNETTDTIILEVPAS